MQHAMRAHYPAPVATVLKMFTDPAFHERKLQAMQLPDFRVLEHGLENGRFRIKVERAVPVNLPGMKNATSRVQHTETWELDSGRGSVEVDMPGMPLKMRCQARMEPDGDACTVHYLWEIKSSVPVVGKQIEKMVVSDMEARAADEAEAARGLLGDYR